MSANTRNSDVSSTQTIVTKEEHNDHDSNTADEMVLRLRNAPATSNSEQTSQQQELRRTVTFTADTVDNEHLGRLKSNCCCIYVPPRTRDTTWTSSYDEHETEHCRGHTIPVSAPSADDTTAVVSVATVANQSPQKKADMGEPLLDENDFITEDVCPLKGLCC